MLEQNPGYVKSERHGQALYIEFFHPQSNSLPKALLNELALQIHAGGLDDEILVIVLRSAGERAFCSGLPLPNFRKSKPALKEKISSTGLPT